MTHEVLDETYARLHGTGPEFVGWLSNHGPMAADALIRLGRRGEVERWVDEYAQRLEEPPRARWPISEQDWREPLGDPVRLGDWCALFVAQLHREPWTDVLARWWPRLLPGAVAASTHGLIRTGHAVRALREQETPQRLDELAHALGYWAARWQPLPGVRPPDGSADAVTALAALPVLGASGGARTRVARLGESAEWPLALGRLRPVHEAAAVPRALDALVDAVTGYRHRAHGSPVKLVHAATAPRAAALVLPALPDPLWRTTHEAAWAVSAATTSAYRPLDAIPQGSTAEPAPPDADEVIDRAVASRDEHAIKFVEVARESNRRGNPHALPASARAAALLTPG